MRNLPRLYITLLAALLPAMLVGCQPSEPWTSENPELALRAFLSALRSSQYETVEAYLSDDTLALLQATRQEQRRLLGVDDDNDDSRSAVELLFRAWTPSAIEIDHLEVIERSDDHAVVAVHGVFGHAEPVSMRRVGGRWVIDLTFETP